METATQPTPIEIECQFCGFKGTALEGAKHRQETQHLIRVVGRNPTPAPQETPAQQGLRAPLAVSESRDVKLKIPHRVLIDEGDWPQAVVYGDTEDDAGAKARFFAKSVNRQIEMARAMSELLVEAEISCVLWQQSQGFVGNVDDAYRQNLMPAAYSRAREALRLAREETE